ncbi:MAG: glucoamylase family protein [Bacteroidales bacterium]
MKTITQIICGISLILIISACGSGGTGSSGAPGGSDTESGPGRITDDSLMTLVQYRTFRYFWDGAEPNSGLARERIHMDGIYPQNDQNVVTSGGSGFGVMAILVGIERGFITREEGLEQLEKIVDFLEQADRFHGIYPHWMYGETGKVKPFSKKDNGADGVESAYLFQGLLAVRQYFRDGTTREKELSGRIDRLWREADWNWFTRGGEHVLYWHWSPEYLWEMNFKVRGYNECLIYYIMAASSPTHPIAPEVYHEGWARSGGIDTTVVTYGDTLQLKHNGAFTYGGPLFWAHYSYLGLDPGGLKDRYADYWKENTSHTLINRQWCIENPDGYKGYGEDCWGLTASYTRREDGTVGYAGHKPSMDLGVISSTAALSSIVYTPEYSLQAMRTFYEVYGDSLFGEYGFYDAFSPQYDWYPDRYLAIDQGPIVVMIENYRSGLLWELFMSASEVRQGLHRLGFDFPE